MLWRRGGAKRDSESKSQGVTALKNVACLLSRLAQHITYVHQHSRQPPAQFEPLDMKLMR